MSAQIDRTVIENFTRLNNELIDTKRELSKSIIELQDQIKQKQHILSIATHDLRNPLGAIKYFVEEITHNNKNKLDPETIDTLQLISHQIDSMLKLIEDLIIYNRLDNIQSDKVRENILLNQVLHLCVQMNALASNRKKIILELKEHTDKITISANKVLIQQVFNNLIDNAIKYSHENSMVFIELSKVNDKALVIVKDNGIGIPENELSKIFSPFFIGNNKPTSDEPRTGLGLSIVKRIVEMHNGTIIVNSKLGEGTNFLVELPIIY